MRGVRGGGGFIHRQYRPGGHAGADQAQRQLVAILRRESRRQRLGQRCSVDVALAVVGVAGVVGHRRLADQFAQFAELAVVTAGDEDVAGPGGVFVVRHQIGVWVAGAFGPGFVEKIVGRLRVQQGHAAIVQRHVDILPEAGRFPLMERHQNADGGVQSRAHVHDRGTQAHGAGGLVAVDAHEAGHGLQDGIVAG